MYSSLILTHHTNQFFSRKHLFKPLWFTLYVDFKISLLQTKEKMNFHIWGPQSTYLLGWIQMSVMFSGINCQFMAPNIVYLVKTLLQNHLLAQVGCYYSGRQRQKVLNSLRWEYAERRGASEHSVFKSLPSTFWLLCSRSNTRTIANTREEKNLCKIIHTAMKSESRVSCRSFAQRTFTE